MKSDLHLDFIRDLFAQFRAVMVKRMFSGAGLYCDGVMFALVVRDTIYLKADATSIADFKSEGSWSFHLQAGQEIGPAERTRPALLAATGPAV